MPAFFLTFLAVLLTSLGARDQLALAMLSLRQGQRPAALITAIAIAVAVTGLAAAGSAALLDMPATTRRMVLAMAVGLAGIELLFTRRPRQPREPTESLAALGVVMLAHQLTDAARLLVFAVAVASHAPWPAGAGGIAGSVAALVLGWSLPELALRPQVVTLRRGLGGIAVLAAAAALFA